MGVDYEQHLHTPDVETTSFGGLLREYRETAGFSQNGLARRAGMNPTNVNRLERGRQGLPRPTTVAKFIGTFGLEFTDERAQKLLEATGLPTTGTQIPLFLKLSCMR